ncbi:MAG TPA: LysR family transcriptional regulator [Candidatus Cryptobacteroides merdipullorum]|uniref:LysR family transcriptional regulator n=1 Tax=Candidatus Cryptobacteroides merdipullorum TaxID=2840771 RepID=A0A9D1GPS9_9BACT|nr:LysR family transcriptional regulator [Candidatus Cryptobacteroides merdipullorum]
MELRQLYYFVKVAETLNFSEAARSLFVTQSTLSQQVKQLEEEFGTALFERDSHSVSLTENGSRLLPLAKRTLQDARDCINQIKDLQEMVSGELIVGVTYSFCPVLTETVKNFIDAYPGVKLRIVSKSSEELISMLRKREVDFVLAFKPNESYDDIESQILFDDRLSVILRNDHPLAGRSSLRMEDLQRQKIALPAKGLQARNALDKSIDIAGQNLNICIELNEINILLDIVQSSHVLTILSEATIYHHKDRLKAIPLEIPQNQMEGCIHVLRKAYRKRSAEAFVRLLRESNEIMERIHRWL